MMSLDTLKNIFLGGTIFMLIAAFLPSNATNLMPSIGTAKMEDDGTIVMQLRAEGPGGPKGDALFQYPPDHPEYKNVLQHLGGLEKGQEKSVPPWKDQK